MNPIGGGTNTSSELEIFIQSEVASRNSSTASVSVDIRKTLFSKFKKKFKSPEPREKESKIKQMKASDCLKPKRSGPSLSVEDIRY